MSWSLAPGRLFAKIFLAFWAAMLLIGAVLVILALTRPPRPMPPPPGGGHRAILADAARAIGQLEQRGPEAALQALRELSDRRGVRVYILRGKREWIAPWPPAPSAMEAAAEARRRGRTVRARNGMTGPCLATPMGGSGPDAYVVVTEPAPGRRVLHLLRLDTFAVRLAVMFLVGSLVCYGLARYLTAPIRTMREATHRIARGDLTARVVPSLGGRRDEIADLGRDLDHMTGRLEELVGSHRRLLRDVSHELRSPLARLGVALELARDRPGPEADAALDRIGLEAERLNDLIGQVMALARLETGPEEAGDGRIDLADMIEEVARDAAFEARPHDKTVEVTSLDPASVRGSPELLRRAVENVVRNAVAFTNPGTAVEIALSGEERETVVQVRDHGPGVPAGALPHLFEPFYRVAEARERTTGGTGLGLAIAQRAVRRHGGSVTAANHPDGGLVVVIRLPARPST